MRQVSVIRRALMVSAAGLALPAFAQGRKATRVVAPFQAGTGSDILIRAIVKHVSDGLAQPMIVENKPGANGAIAGLDVASAPADGSTLFVGSSTATSGVVALSKKPAYDPVAAFSGITLVGYHTVYLFVSTELPVRTVGELIAYGRAHPNELRYGSPHATAKVAGAQLALLGKMEMVDVPYKGEVAQLTDLTTNRIQLSFASPASLMPFVASGKLRVLATIMPRRSKFAPDVPTMAEAGLVGFNTAGWTAMLGHKQLPRDLRDSLAKAFGAAMGQPDVAAIADQIQLALRSSTPAEMDKHLADDAASYKRIVREARIELE